MAGGLFVDRPFHFNTKCVVFGVALMLAYWFLPVRQFILLPLIFVIAYISMAWYDHLYNCSDRLLSGTSPIGVAIADAWAKPWHTENIDNNMNQVLAYKRNVHFFHMFIVLPLFISFAVYADWNNGEAIKKNYPALIGIRWFLGISAVIMILVHSYRLFIKQRELAPWETIENVKTVNMFHMIVVGFLMLMCSFYPSTVAFTTLGVAGFATGSYHAWLLANGK